MAPVYHVFACATKCIQKRWRRFQAMRKGQLVNTFFAYFHLTASSFRAAFLQVVLAGTTLSETLEAASESHGETVVALRSTAGAVITDLNILRSALKAVYQIHMSSVLQGLGRGDSSYRGYVTYTVVSLAFLLLRVGLASYMMCVQVYMPSGWCH